MLRLMKANCLRCDSNFIKSKNHDYNIQLGSLEMFKKKLLNYKFFYVTKYDKDIILQVEKINLKFENQIIVEKK